MELVRRRFLHLAASTAAFQALPSFVRAQSYPARPVRFIVPFAVAGPLDILARLMTGWLSDRLGQQFVVENRTGAGGNIGTEAATKATPDGYTFLIVGASSAINRSLYRKLNFDVLSDMIPVAGIMRGPNVLEVHPSVPAKTILELIAFAKANPGKVTMASAGVGSNQHMSGELFKMLAGVDLVHVPYNRGAATALTDLLGGQVQIMIDSIPSSIEYIKAGKLRALGVTSATRLDILPDIPTVAEFVPGYEANGLAGLVAPKNTSPEIIERLNREINTALENPIMKARFAELGAIPIPGSPADFGIFFAREAEKWAQVVQFSGARVE